jgi:hypothetical protein
MLASAPRPAHHHVAVTPFDLVDRRILRLVHRVAAHSNSRSPRAASDRNDMAASFVAATPLSLAAKVANHAREITRPFWTA